MAGESSGGTGSGAAGAGEGGAGGGQPNNPPAGTQGGGAGGGQGPAGGPGEPIRGVNPDVLPPDLRGKSDAELKFILGNMVKSVGTSAQRIKQLEQELAASKKEPPPESKEPAKPYEERILDDPEGTIAEIVEKRYGGVITALDERTARSELAMARRELDDFSEYEDEVYRMLDEAGAPRTFQNIAGAYTMAVGQRTLKERQDARTSALGMEEGGGSPPEGEGKKVELTPLEKEVARVQGMTDEQWIAAKELDPFSVIKVPTGEKRG